MGWVREVGAVARWVFVSPDKAFDLIHVLLAAQKKEMVEGGRPSFWQSPGKM